MSKCQDISVPQLNTSQKVKVTGTHSLGQKEHKKVLVKSTQQISFVKEDCILEDSKGHTSIHIRSPLITKLKDNCFLSPEQFDSEKLSRQHLPVYFTIHHLYSGGEHPVLFERASNSRNFRETNLCWQLQIT